jgi:hypothetical protein
MNAKIVSDISIKEAIDCASVDQAYDVGMVCSIGEPDL